MAGASIGEGNLDAVLARDGHCCAYCGSTEALTLDHLVALNDGGSHEMGNFVAACNSCNSSKRDRPVESWFRSQPSFTSERWSLIEARLSGREQVMQLNFFQEAA